MGPSLPQWSYDKCSRSANDYWGSMMDHTGLGPGDTTENRACSLILGRLTGHGAQQHRQAVKIHLATSHQPTPVFLPGKSHGQRSLASSRPGGCWESGMTEHAHLINGHQGVPSSGQRALQKRDNTEAKSWAMIREFSGKRRRSRSFQLDEWHVQWQEKWEPGKVRACDFEQLQRNMRSGRGNTGESGRRSPFEDRLPAQMIIFTEWSPGARASQVALVVKNLPTNAGDSRDVGSIPGSGRSLGGRHDNPLQYSHLEHPMDRGTWWTTVHWVAESQTQLKQLCTHTPGARYFSSISHISPLLILPTTPKKSVLLYYYYG